MIPKIFKKIIKYLEENKKLSLYNYFYLELNIGPATSYRISEDISKRYKNIYYNESEMTLELITEDIGWKK